MKTEVSNRLLDVLAYGDWKFSDVEAELGYSIITDIIIKEPKDDMQEFNIGMALATLSDRNKRISNKDISIAVYWKSDLRMLTDEELICCYRIY